MKYTLAIIVLLVGHFLHSQSRDEKLQQLNIKFPEKGKPLGNYADFVRVGNLIFLAGKGPLQENGTYVNGKLGKELSVEQGYHAAKLTAVHQLTILMNELGGLSRIKRIIKVNGYVNCENNFHDQAKVVNGFSDLLIEIFSKNGKHARTAIGVNSLLSNMAVEIEMIVEVE